ncbi:prepilin peptidase [Lentzea sp. JNUCC 0626]|uniref:prepilin peptidase n=1 Tax=Lentzea sp. JNUCC 0626 TaxID=3367513 RepID=UPI00374888A6
MPLWLNYGLLGAVAGPFVIVFSRAIAPLGHVVPKTVIAFVASLLLTVVLIEVAERRQATAGALAWLAIIGLLLSLIDWAHHRLPHRIVGALLAGGSVQLGFAGLVQHDLWPLARAGAAAAAVFAFMFLVHRISPSGLGFGDVTLSTTMAFYLGWFGWPYVAAGLGAAFLSAGIAMCALRVTKLISQGQAIAFGPALIFAPFCVILLL